VKSSPACCGLCGRVPSSCWTGARQTGKTSTFRRLFPEHEFVSLDLPTEAEQAEKEPQTFSNGTWRRSSSMKFSMRQAYSAT